MTQREDAAPNIAIFADFENVALGVRDANYDNLDINLIIERLLDKGKVVVKKAYADWERYKYYKRSMHEASFEMVEIPHVSYSGKNSADIRLVVDALDLCYTKSHIDMFVIVSGDSDFSPLVSKLRENDKKVIGVGVKNSSSDLLVDNCDEFIYYDDLIGTLRKGAKSGGKGGFGRGAKAASAAGSGGSGGVKAAGKAAKTTETAATAGATKAAEGKVDAKADAKAERPERADKSDKTEKADKVDKTETVASAEAEARIIEERKAEAIELLLDVVESLFRERDDNLWGSMVKQTLKRKKPNFSESFHGYRTFNEMLQHAQKLGVLELQKDERSGGYLITGFGPNA